MNRQWDVVIVGARVAGAATAMLLARAGLRVLCVDRSRYGSDTISTHALMRGGVMQLNRWGLLDDLVAAGTPRIQRTVFHYGDESVGVSIKPYGGVVALFAPRRTLLDTLIVDHAVRAGAVFEFGARVTDLHRDGNGVVDGVVARSAGARTNWVARAPLVIGADGRDSTVARAVDAARITDARHASSFLYSYWSHLPANGYEWFYGAGITAGAIPTNEGLTCVFIGAPPGVLGPQVRASTAAEVFHRLRRAAGLDVRLRGATPADSMRFVHSLPPSYLRAAHGPGWALVGDAGHWLDPVSTHGMTAALRDAELLAHAVVSSPPRSRDLQMALTGYQAARDRLSTPMIRATDEIAGYAWDLTRVRALLRSLSSAMTDEVETLGSLACVS
jgi:2-polyprenyl-6-methoxyphenol hydroxylase-like FAD-dependent oxidoreductase